MKKSLIILILPVLLRAADPYYFKDTVLTTPELPTTADSVKLDLFNFTNC